MCCAAGWEQCAPAAGVPAPCHSTAPNVASPFCCLCAAPAPPGALRPFTPKALPDSPPGSGWAGLTSVASQEEGGFALETWSLWLLAGPGLCVLRSCRIFALGGFHVSLALTGPSLELGSSRDTSLSKTNPSPSPALPCSLHAVQHLSSSWVVAQVGARPATPKLGTCLCTCAAACVHAGLHVCPHIPGCAGGLWDACRGSSAG